MVRLTGVSAASKTAQSGSKKRQKALLHEIEEEGLTLFTTFREEPRGCYFL